MKKKIIIRILLLISMSSASCSYAAFFQFFDSISPQLDQISKCIERYTALETQAVSINGQSVLKSNIISAQNGTSGSVSQECANLIQSASNDSKGTITVTTRTFSTSIAPSLTDQTFKFSPMINNTALPLSSQPTATNITGWQCQYIPSTRVDLKRLKVSGTELNALSKFPYLLIC